MKSKGKKQDTRLSVDAGVRLLTDGDPIELGIRADEMRRQLFDDTVTFIVDRNINYTNVCKNECRFCAFFRRKELLDVLADVGGRPLGEERFFKREIVGKFHHQCVVF